MVVSLVEGLQQFWGMSRLHDSRRLKVCEFQEFLVQLGHSGLVS